MEPKEAIAKIDKWLKVTGMAESRLGMLSAANPHAIARIRAGTARVETLQAVLDYIAENIVIYKRKPAAKAKKD